MAKMKVVVDNYGIIKAAARINPENEYSPVEIEVKSGESLHEVDVPEEVQSGGLGILADFKLALGGEPKLVKQTV
ncbi:MULTISPECIES: hypothetical protein [unclassified Streptomyces]|uniref:hypothetical protein n=1 Tax=unclassified Streptomyces TaxID=2593676 RepID=UPI0011AFA63B|nr:hypothetical protein [Streptomyces sp. CB02959]